MRTIGIRVTPKTIFYTIIVDDEKITHETLIIPIALNNDTPRQLSFIRTTLHSIICEYDVQYAGIRTIEGNARTWNRFRINIEGVIQELFSDSTILYYFAGTKSSIQSRLGISATEINECIDGTSNIYLVNNWENIDQNHRESFLVAKSALLSSRRD
ncbi:hypothetical protein ACFSKI_15265 [Pseudogracilibacillus auburnensis]|uniref:Uncharacterized protein n=1 Tax=Pseudogracilibacillus auburnensis TaxID=1494959 RepID=A0A2V3VL28_9BACI|nr:hypothetical protein [Pseudogracilibacillus auburnensis]PXW82503.1 hypothetical protein DFR56_11880 [Pseudogracilibacillus auburnensis]